MKKPAKWIGVVLALLLVAVIALPFVVDAKQFRPMLESSLTQVLARDVKLGDLKLAILSGGVSASDLSIADDPAYSRTPFLQAKSLKIGVELWPLILSRKLNVTGLTIERPQVQLIQAPSGDWNFSNLGGQGAAKTKAAEPAPTGKSMELAVQLVKITGGRFSLGKTGGHSKPLVLDEVNAEMREFSAASSFPFSLGAKVVGGGDLELNGKAGPIRDDVAMTPLQVSLKVSRLDLAGSGWAQAVPGMGGIVSLDGTGESDGATGRVNGRLTVEKLKLARNATPAPRNVELDFAVEHDLKSQSGRVSRGDIHIGSAVASLTGTYAKHAGATDLKMELSGPAMPVTELAAMLPALGVVLPAGSTLQGGTAAVKLAMEGPADRLVTSGSLRVNNTTLAGFDLGLKISVIEALAGIKGGPNTEIQSLSMDARVTPEGTAAENLQLVVPAIGELGGGGTISPTNALDFKMNAKVHTSGVAAALGKETIPFTVTGTASDPVFRPDVKAVVTEKAKGIGQKAAGSLLKGLLGGKKNQP